MDTIHIDGLELDCIVGIRPFERRRRQPVRLDLALGLELSEAGRTGRIGHTCDYDLVTDEVRALIQFRSYRLLEVAAEELAAMLFAVHPALREVRLRLDKPAALHGRARSAGVSVVRQREDFPSEQLVLADLVVARVLETDEAGLYLVSLAAGERIKPLPPPEPTQSLEWVVAGEIVRGERLLGPGHPIEQPRPLFPPPARATERGATLFWCTCPPWSPRLDASGAVARSAVPSSAVPSGESST